MPRLVPAGAVLVEEGETGESMFVLAEGLIEVSTESGGARVTLAKLQPGACAGEMSLLTGEPRSARLAAVTDVLVYEVTREHLMPILTARPALFEAISELVARRRLNTGERLAAAAAPQEMAETRVAQAQILGRMRLFFRAIGQRHTA
jgi:CRP-like cAMP-binding protein